MTAAEDNWSMCLRLAREQDKDELIHKLLMQIAKMRNPRDRHGPLWSYVGQATNHGSGVSCGICTVYGVNSHSGDPVFAKPAPESTPDSKLTETIGSGREPTPLQGEKNSGSGDNVPVTDGGSFVNIESSEASGDSHTVNSGQELGAKQPENSGGPEGVLDGKFASPLIDGRNVTK